MHSENLLNTDIFEDDEKRLEVNEKITSMLNKYFKIDSSKNLDKEEGNYYYNGKHLYINYLEFKSYKDIADKADFDKKEFDLKHDEAYEKIAKANIYPGKYEYNPISSMNEEDQKFYKKCFCIVLILITLSTLFLLLVKQIVLFLIFYLIGAICQFIYVYDKFLDFEELNGEIVKKLEKILNAKPCLELFYGGECLIKIPFHSYADISGIKFIKNGDFENVVFEKIDLDTQNVVYQFPIKLIYFC